MFKRENRLVRGIRFNNAHFFSTLEFVLKEKGNSLKLNRFGIIISKKIDKRAVVRNKYKRILREALIGLNNNIPTGHDMLFIVKPGIIKKTKGEISLSVKEAVRKMGFMMNQ